MIASLQDLQEFTRRQAETVPILFKETFLSVPGCSGDDTDKLLKFEPLLPPIYLKCIKHFALKGIQISGYFLPWPGKNLRKGTFVEDFKNAQSLERYDGYEKVASSEMFIAASWSSDLVAVGKVGSKAGTDRVSMFVRADPEEGPYPLAPDFEKFLLAAGNVAELYMDKSKQERDVLLVERLRAIGLREEEVKIWHLKTEGLFGKSDSNSKWRP